MKKLILLLILILLFTVQAQASDIVAHYKLNDDANTAVVLDDKGLYNGTYKSAGGDANTADHNEVGKTEGALDFVGDDDYIEVADAAAFSPVLTPFSISAWVYMHDATNFVIASKGVLNTDGEWQVFTSGADKLYASFYDESVATCYIGRLYNTALTTTYEDVWVHIVATYDGGISSSGIKLYLNGTRVDDANYEASASSFEGVENLTHAVWVGRYNTGYANGVIDNVMLFAKELTIDEIQILYNDGDGTETVEDLGAWGWFYDLMRRMFGGGGFRKGSRDF